MNEIKIIWMMCIIFIAGCSNYQIPTSPYLDSVGEKTQIISIDGNKTDVRFFIINPMINTVAVNVTYQMTSNNCFNPINSDYYEVYPHTSKAVIKQIVMKENLTEECKGTTLSVFLFDVSGDFKDSLQYEIYVTKKSK